MCPAPLPSPAALHYLILQSKTIWVLHFLEWSNTITLQHPAITKKLQVHSRTAWWKSPCPVCVFGRLSNNSLTPQIIVILEDLCAWCYYNKGATSSILDKRNRKMKSFACSFIASEKKADTRIWSVKPENEVDLVSAARSPWWLG